MFHFSLCMKIIANRWTNFNSSCDFYWLLSTCTNVDAVYDIWSNETLINFKGSKVNFNFFASLFNISWHWHCGDIDSLIACWLVCDNDAMPWTSLLQLCIVVRLPLLLPAHRPENCREHGHSEATADDITSSRLVHPSFENAAKLLSRWFLEFDVERGHFDRMTAIGRYLGVTTRR